MSQEPGPAEDQLSAADDARVIRASDADREAVAARLIEAAGDGTLRLPEFSQRLDGAYAARTHGELAKLIADLPGADPARRPAKLRRLMLGICWDSRRAGPQPLEDEITAIALLGDAVIDLREATVTSKEVTIRAYALLNDVDVIVPEGTALELSGLAVVGDHRNFARLVPPGSSRLVVKIHGHAVLGDVQVFHCNPRAARGWRRRPIQA